MELNTIQENGLKLSLINKLGNLLSDDMTWVRESLTRVVFKACRLICMKWLHCVKVWLGEFLQEGGKGLAWIVHNQRFTLFVTVGLQHEMCGLSFVLDVLNLIRVYQKFLAILQWGTLFLKEHSGIFEPEQYVYLNVWMSHIYQRFWNWSGNVTLTYGHFWPSKLQRNSASE